VPARRVQRRDPDQVPDQRHEILAPRLADDLRLVRTEAARGLASVPRAQLDEATRKAFDAALEEFRRVGVESASVARIARTAGVSRPSFYFHFPSKEHVLLELQWQAEQRIVDDIAAEQSVSSAMHTFADRLAAVEVELGSGDLFRDILQLWARGATAVDEDDLPVLDEIVRRFQQHHREGGQLALEPERAAVLFLSGVFGYLLGVADDDGRRAADLHALVELHLGAAP